MKVFVCVCVCVCAANKHWLITNSLAVLGHLVPLQDQRLQVYPINEGNLKKFCDVKCLTDGPGMPGGPSRPSNPEVPCTTFCGKL